MPGAIAAAVQCAWHIARAGVGEKPAARNRRPRGAARGVIFHPSISSQEGDDPPRQDSAAQPADGRYDLSSTFRLRFAIFRIHGHETAQPHRAGGRPPGRRSVGAGGPIEAQRESCGAASGAYILARRLWPRLRDGRRRCAHPAAARPDHGGAAARRPWYPGN